MGGYFGKRQVVQRIWLRYSQDRKQAQGEEEKFVVHDDLGFLDGQDNA